MVTASLRDNSAGRRQTATSLVDQTCVWPHGVSCSTLALRPDGPRLRLLMSASAPRDRVSVHRERGQWSGAGSVRECCGPCAISTHDDVNPLHHRSRTPVYPSHRIAAGATRGPLAGIAPPANRTLVGDDDRAASREPGVEPGIDERGILQRRTVPAIVDHSQLGTGDAAM